MIPPSRLYILACRVTVLRRTATMKADTSTKARPGHESSVRIIVLDGVVVVNDILVARG